MYKYDYKQFLKLPIDKQFEAITGIKLCWYQRIIAIFEHKCHNIKMRLKMKFDPKSPYNQIKKIISESEARKNLKK